MSEGALPRLLDRLIELALVDDDPVREGRRAVLVAPDWQEGDDSERIASELMARLDALPDLPSKIGFAIDAGTAPILVDDPADFRIERSGTGHLILRADGRESGMRITRDGAVDALIALARWFVDSGGTEAGRMARHAAPLPAWARADDHPARGRARLSPGAHALGQAYGIAFGSMEADRLARLMTVSRATALRVTPWRTIVLEGGLPTGTDGFVSDAGHPAMTVEACPGMPACPQATVETRALAMRLAPHVAGHLHVSGCGKGCAHAAPALVTLTGRDGLFDLSFDSRAGDAPARSGLGPDQLLAHFGAD